MSADGFVEEVEDRALRQAQGLHNGQDALDEAAAVGTMATEATTAPQHRAPLDTFGMVVGRLYALDNNESPQGRKLPLQTRAETPGLAVTRAPAAAEHFPQ